MRSQGLAALILGLVCRALTAPPPTPLQGNITGEVTLTADKSPYHVTADIKVLNGSKLTIEPGVKVLFAPRVGLDVYGMLDARGTEEKWIEFSALGEPADYQPDPHPKVRLEGGDVPYKGRLQIKDRRYGDRWLALCDSRMSRMTNNWADPVANAACQNIGYFGKSYLTNEFRSLPRDPSVLRKYGRVDCSKGSSSIQHCRLRTSRNCATTNDIGVICSNETRVHYWRGIHMTVTDPKWQFLKPTELWQPSRLEYVNIFESGIKKGYIFYPALYIDRNYRHAPTKLDHIKVVQTMDMGMRIDALRPLTLSYITISQCLRSGLNLNHMEAIVMRNSEFLDNGEQGVALRYTPVFPDVPDDDDDSDYEYDSGEDTREKRAAENSDQYEFCTYNSGPVSGTVYLMRNMEYTQDGDCSVDFRGQPGQILRTEVSDSYAYDVGITILDLGNQKVSHWNTSMPGKFPVHYSSSERIRITLHPSNNPEYADYGSNYMQLKISAVSKDYVDVEISNVLIEDNLNEGFKLDHAVGLTHLRSIALSRNDYGFQFDMGNRGPLTKLIITDSTFMNNTHIGAKMPCNQFTLIQNCSFLNNGRSGVEVSGRNYFSGTIRVDKSTFDGNKQENLKIDLNAASATATISEVHFKNSIYGMYVLGERRRYQVQAVTKLLVEKCVFVDLMKGIILGQNKGFALDVEVNQCTFVNNKGDSFSCWVDPFIPLKASISGNTFSGPIIVYGRVLSFLGNRPGKNENDPDNTLVKSRHEILIVNNVIERLSTASRANCLVETHTTEHFTFRRNVLDNPKQKCLIALKEKGASQRVVSLAQNFWGDTLKGANILGAVYASDQDPDLVGFSVVPYYADRSMKVLLSSLKDTFKRGRRIGGMLTSAAYLTQKESPYRVDQDITVHPAGILNIEAGVTLLFPESTHMIINGKLDARGEKDRVIEFKTDDRKPSVDVRVLQRSSAVQLQSRTTREANSGEGTNASRYPEFYEDILEVREPGKKEWAAVCSVNGSNSAVELTNTLCKLMGKGKAYVSDGPTFMAPQGVPVYENLTCSAAAESLKDCKFVPCKNVENNTCKCSLLRLRCDQKLWGGIQIGRFATRSTLHHVRITDAQGSYTAGYSLKIDQDDFSLKDLVFDYTYPEEEDWLVSRNSLKASMILTPPFSSMVLGMRSEIKNINITIRSRDFAGFLMPSTPIRISNMNIMRILKPGSGDRIGQWGNTQPLFKKDTNFGGLFQETLRDVSTAACDRGKGKNITVSPAGFSLRVYSHSESRDCVIRLTAATKGKAILVVPMSPRTPTMRVKRSLAYGENNLEDDFNQYPDEDCQEAEVADFNPVVDMVNPISYPVPDRVTETQPRCGGIGTTRDPQSVNGDAERVKRSSNNENEPSKGKNSILGKVGRRVHDTFQAMPRPAPRNDNPSSDNYFTLFDGDSNQGDALYPEEGKIWRSTSSVVRLEVKSGALQVTLRIIELEDDQNVVEGLLENIHITGSGTGQEKGMEIRGSRLPAEVITNIKVENCDRALEFRGKGQLRVIGAEFKSNNACLTADTDSDGYNSVLVKSSLFENCGVHGIDSRTISNKKSDLTVIQSNFVENKVAVYATLSSQYTTVESLNISRNNFRRNQLALKFFPGWAHSCPLPKIEIVDNVFDGNLLVQETNGVDVSFRRNVFVKNSALFNHVCGNLTDNTFEENDIQPEGIKVFSGAIKCSDLSQIRIRNNTFLRNKIYDRLLLVNLKTNVSVAQNQFRETSIINDSKITAVPVEVCESRKTVPALIEAALFDNLTLEYNVFHNPALPWELQADKLEPGTVLNAPFNYWGSDEISKVKRRILDSNLDSVGTNSSVDVTPFFEDEALTKLSSADDRHTPTSNEIRLTLKGSPHKFYSDLIVKRNETLLVQPGVRLVFAPGTSLIVFGSFLAFGSPTARIVMDVEASPAVPCDSTFIRLVNTTTPWEGIVEVNVYGSWEPICLSDQTTDNWKTYNAEVACKQLGFAASRYDVEMKGPMPEQPPDMSFVFRCNDGKTSLKSCYRRKLRCPNPPRGLLKLRCLPSNDKWGGIVFVSGRSKSSTLRYVDINNVGFFRKKESSAISILGGPAPEIYHVDIAGAGSSGIVAVNVPDTLQITSSTIRDAMLSGIIALGVQALNISGLKVDNVGQEAIVLASPNEIAPFETSRSDLTVFGDFVFRPSQNNSVFVQPYKTVTLSTLQTQSALNGRVQFHTSSGHRLVAFYRRDNKQTVRFILDSAGKYTRTGDYPSGRYWSVDSTMTVRADTPDTFEFMDVTSLPEKFAPCTFDYGDKCTGWEISSQGGPRNCTVTATEVTQWTVCSRNLASSSMNLPTDHTTGINGRGAGRYIVIGSAQNNRDEGERSNSTFTLVEPVMADDNVCGLELFHYVWNADYYGRKKYTHVLTIGVTEENGQTRNLFEHRVTKNDGNWKRAQVEFPADMSYPFRVFIMGDISLDKGSQILLDDIALLPCKGAHVNKMAIQMENVEITNYGRLGLRIYSTTGLIHPQISLDRVSVSDNMRKSEGTQRAMDVVIGDGQIRIENSCFSNITGDAIMIELLQITQLNSTADITIRGTEITDITEGVALGIRRIDKAAGTPFKVALTNTTIARAKYKRNPPVDIRNIDLTMEGSQVVYSGGPEVSSGVIHLEEGDVLMQDSLVAFNSFRPSNVPVYIRCKNTLGLYSNVFVNTHRLCQAEIYVSQTEGPFVLNTRDNWWGTFKDAEKVKSCKVRVYSTQRPTVNVNPILGKPPQKFLSVSACPLGWFRIGNWCYGLHSGARNYDKAETQCAIEGGKLLEESMLKENREFFNSSFSNGIDNQKGAFCIWIKRRNSISCQIFDVMNPASATSDEECDNLRPYVCRKAAENQCPNGCSGNGACFGTSCVCDYGYSLPDCAKTHCLDVRNCSGKGECVGPNECKCRKPYTGSRCNMNQCQRLRSNCGRCIKMEGCGWCITQRVYGKRSYFDNNCVPGNETGPHAGSYCKKGVPGAWFYHSCLTVDEEDEHCEKFKRPGLKVLPCKKLCNNTLIEGRNDKCQKCEDLMKCYSSNKPFLNCKSLNYTRCPGGFPKADYSDPQRMTRTIFQDNLRPIDPKETVVYHCPMVMDGSGSEASLFIVDKMINVTEEDIISSPQSGGILHKVEGVWVAGNYTLIQATEVPLDEVVKYADFKNEMDLIPIEDPLTTEYTPDEELIEMIANETITTSGKDAVVFINGTPAYKCVGHEYGDESFTTDASTFYIVLPITSDSDVSMYPEGAILAGNQSHGYLETIEGINETDFATIYKTKLTQCTDDPAWKPKIRNDGPVADLTCFGGDNWPGMLVIPPGANQTSQEIGDMVPGRSSGPFIGQVLKTSKKEDYLFIELIPVVDLTSETIVTLADVTKVQKKRRKKRAGSVNLSSVFSRNVKTKLTGNAQANSDLKVDFKPKFNLDLDITTDSPYLHEIGATFDGRLEVFLESKIEFEGSFTASGPRDSRLRHPVNNKEVGRFALPIWLAPTVALPGRFLFDLTFGIVASAEGKGHIVVSSGVKGRLKGGAKWTASRGLRAEKPVLSFTPEKTFDASLDKDGNKASITVTLTPTFKAQWPTASIPKRLRKLLPGFIKKVLGSAKGKGSNTVKGHFLQIWIKTPLIAEAWAHACAENCQQEPEKPLHVGAKAGMSHVSGSLHFDAFGFSGSNDFLDHETPGLMASDEKCMEMPIPCCLCEEDGSPGVVDPETGDCMCKCFCDPPKNTKESVKPKDGECLCELCPDKETYKKKKDDGTLWCPCDCLDGEKSEMNEKGECDCPCQCEDGKNGTRDANGGCIKCECECKNCDISHVGEDGECVCPNDICQNCTESEPEWVDCKCQCKDWSCGISPACLPGLKGESCDVPDCIQCPTCNNHGTCQIVGDGSTCTSQCVCRLQAGGRLMWCGDCCQETCPARRRGDPHLETVDGVSYDYFGIGEFWDCMSVENDFGSQFRFFGYNKASLTGGMAIKIGKSIVTVMTLAKPTKDDMPILRINGKRRDIKTSRLSVENGTAHMDIQTNSDADKDVALAMISFEFKSGVKLGIDARYSPVMKRQYLNSLFAPTIQFLKKTKGLCGYFDEDESNDLQGPDGTLYPDPIKFADSWRITSSHKNSGLYDTWSWGASNFHPDDKMDISYTDPTYVPLYGTKNLSADQVMAANETCQKMNVTSTNDLDSCIFDVAVTGDDSMAKQEALKTGCPNMCSGRGRCVDGKCQCIKGWSGDDCNIGDCDGYCNNGKCEATFCRCDIGWVGTACDKRATCFAVDNCTDVVHGRCKEMDVCLCNPGFTGTDCSKVATCHNVANCSGHGFCVDTDVCRCHKGWNGTQCDLFTCEQVNTCTGNGQCIGYDVCRCNPGWRGPACSKPECSSLQDCSSRGTCIQPNTCQCYEGYTGENCSQRLPCPGLEDCNNRGLCLKNVTTGKLFCSCFQGYLGNSCETVQCDDVSNCSDRGKCLEPNICQCIYGYTGRTCSEFSCQGRTFCSGHGKCVGLDQCRCDTGWSGLDCDGASCLGVNHCSSLGTCIGSDICQCYPGYEGNDCTTESPENLNQPVFKKSEINATVREDVKPGTKVTQFVAEDQDTGRNGEIKYRMSWNSGENQFEVDKKSGKVTVKKVLDREKRDLHRLKIVAEDSGIPPQSATAYLNVFVKDTNDNCPIFTEYPKNPVYIQADEENLGVITKVTAKDADSGKNGEVSYSFHIAPEYFSINNATGEITLVKSAPSGAYSLTIQATDRASNPCSKQVKIYVQIVRFDLSAKTTESTSRPTSPSTSPVTSTTSLPTTTKPVEKVSPSPNIAVIVSVVVIVVLLLVIVAVVVLVKFRGKIAKIRHQHSYRRDEVLDVELKETM